MDAGDDAGGVQTVMGQKLGSVAGLAKAGHAQTAHATGLLFCQQLRDRGTHAAVDAVLLDGEDHAGLGSAGENGLLVQGLDAHDVDDLCGDALLSEELCRVEGVGQLHAACHDGDVGALADHVGERLGVYGEVLAVDLGQRLAAHAHVERAGGLCGELDGGAGGVVVSRNQHAHMGQNAHEGDVLERLVGLAVRADGNAGMGGAHLDVEVGDAHRVADLLPAAAGAKDRKGTGEDGAAGKRQAGGDADHVLLGDAHVDKAVRVGCSKLGGGGGTGEVGIDGHDVDALVHKLEKGGAESGTRCFCHGVFTPPSQRAARAPHRSLPGRRRPAPRWERCRASPPGPP